MQKPITDKFLLYDLTQKGFMDVDGHCTESTNIEESALYSLRTCDRFALSFADDAQFLQIPVTKEWLQELPFELYDTDPNVSVAEAYDRDACLAGDFVVLTEQGFYDEKYNSLTNTSRPKVRSFELDYATLYNQNVLTEMGTDGILKGDPAPLIIPVNETQQKALNADPRFGKDQEPYGFFMTPIGETMAKEPENMEELDTAVDDLSEDLPWELT